MRLADFAIISKFFPDYGNGRDGGLAVGEGTGGTAPSQATTMPRAVLAIILSGNLRGLRGSV